MVVDFETLLASACDIVASRHYRRGRMRASLGAGVKQTLLRQVLRAYGRFLTRSGQAPAPAPRLLLSRRDLHEWRCELAHAELAGQQASDALYEWALLFRQNQVVDIELDARLYRIVMGIDHTRDAERSYLRVEIHQDLTQDHNYTTITMRSLEDTTLRVLLATKGANPDQLSAAESQIDNEPLSRDLTVVTAFLTAFARSIADKMPERIRKAAARIREDRRQKKASAWTTALAVLAILIAGMFAFRKITIHGLADTVVDVSRGTTEKVFAIEQDGNRFRLVDPTDRRPRTDWAQSIVDEVTGDRIDVTGLGTFMFHAGENLTACELTCDQHPTSYAPRWWFLDDGTPEPGIAAEALPGKRGREALHILFAIFPEFRRPAVLDAVRRGQTVIDFGEGLRLTGMKYVDTPSPFLVGSYHFREAGLKEIAVQWHSPQGTFVEEQYALLCVGGPTGTHPPETVILRVDATYPFATWYRCDQNAIWSKLRGTWQKTDEKTLLAEYRRDPTLPQTFKRRGPAGGPSYTNPHLYDPEFQ